VICVINQIKYITGLNPLFIPTGLYVVKNVGILFLNKVLIPMEEQESQNYNSASKFAKNNLIIEIWNYIKLNQIRY